MTEYTVIVAGGLHTKTFGEDLEAAKAHAKRCIFVTGTDVIITKTIGGKLQQKYLVIQVNGEERFETTKRSV